MFNGLPKGNIFAVDTLMEAMDKDVVHIFVCVKDSAIGGAYYLIVSGVEGFANVFDEILCGCEVCDFLCCHLALCFDFEGKYTPFVLILQIFLQFFSRKMQQILKIAP